MLQLLNQAGPPVFLSLTFSYFIMRTVALYAALLSLLLSFAAQAQGVGIGTAAPNSSAVLELKSTSQGLLLPRLTSLQRAAIAFPPAGLLIFQTDDPSGLYYYNGTSWFTAGGSPSPVGGKVSTLAPGFGRPTGVAGDGNGNVYVADQNNNRIYKIVTATSVVSTLAGSGTAGLADGAGASAKFSSPPGVACDASGNV